MEGETQPKKQRQWHPSGVLESNSEKDIRFKIALAILGTAFALVLLAVMLKKDQSLIQRILSPLPEIPESIGKIEADSQQKLPWRKAIAQAKKELAGSFPDLAFMELQLNPEELQKKKGFRLTFYSDQYLAVLSIEASPVTETMPGEMPLYELKTKGKHLVSPNVVRELLETRKRSEAVELLKLERTKALARVKKQ